MTGRCRTGASSSMAWSAKPDSRDLDVLLYGIGIKVDLMLGAPDGPLRTGRTFGFDGACLLHAHIRMRDSTQFWAGYLAYITDPLGYLTESTTAILMIILHGKDDRPELPLVKKVNRLVCALGEAGLGGPDVELFRCAANIIRQERNRCVHLVGDLNPPGCHLGVHVLMASQSFMTRVATQSSSL